MPEPLVKVSTDLYAAAAGVFLGTGLLMMMLHNFDAGEHDGDAFGAADLYVLGGVLLFIEFIAVWRLLTRFAEEDEELEDGPADKADPPSGLAIAGFGLLGIATSVVGGHAVGDFADILVDGLNEAGYSEMVGALILSVFAAAGAFAMIITAHAKGMYEIALASASGQINQVPFVVLPVALILLGIFAQTGVVPVGANGGVLPIDLETTSVVVLAFPTMLILWKAVQDDGKVNWVETASMVGLFALVVYFLARHG
ncbi:MAG: sodium/calcium exchanger protein [Myxococcota bacterium]